MILHLLLLLVPLLLLYYYTAVYIMIRLLALVSAVVIPIPPLLTVKVKNGRDTQKAI